MINTKLNEIKFNFTGPELHQAIKSQLENTAIGILDIYGLSEKDIDRITTKTEPQCLYSKLVLRHLLVNCSAIFDESYLNSAYKFYQCENNDESKINYLYTFLVSNQNIIEYKKQYLKEIGKGVGPLLIALHSSKAITLPWSFSWPSVVNIQNADQTRRDIGKYFASGLLAFIRKLDTKRPGSVESSFDIVGADVRRREWFSGYATKTLLALGWHSLEDVNSVELITLRNELEPKITVHIPDKLLVEVLCREYKDGISITQKLYADCVKKVRWITKVTKLTQKNNAWIDKTSESGRLKKTLKEITEGLEASDAYPETLQAMDLYPSINIDFKAISKTWLEIETAYFNRRKNESNKQAKSAIGWLNIYLFLYLPQWFAAQDEIEINFPDNPSKLLGGVFISRMIDVSGPVPETLMQMMDSLQESRQWTGNSYYALLKQIQIFFDFIERNSHSLPSCIGFHQPLTIDDFPATTSRRGTNKRPIEKRLFGVVLSLVESLILYSEIITQRILDRELDCRLFQAEVARFGRVIDTFQVAHLTGVIPVLFYKGKVVPLRIIPNCLSFTESHKLKNYEYGVQIPSPHALNQIFVALHTGLRHNHIQWLDERTFDKWASDKEMTFTQLLVNTDKRKNEAWAPYVSSQVIDCLCAQRKWRNLFDEPGFLIEHFYNDNSKTKWDPILPLFSFARSGVPHSDVVYSRVWGLLLSTLQGLLSELDEDSNLPSKSYGKLVPRIGMLEPSHVEYNDSNAVEKRKAAGEKKYKGTNTEMNYVPLDFKSPRTPHSTRLSVVQQYMSYLPADYIGKYITGQTARTVYYYYVPDSVELAQEGIHQAMAVRNKDVEDYGGLHKFNLTGTKSIRADGNNCNLAQSLRENLNETIEAHGCVSLSLANSELSGIEVLRKTMAVDAVLNKTEICPYGNRCPVDVVKLLNKANRCGLCPYAVRSVDHLPAVSAKVKQLEEELAELRSKIDDASRCVPERFSDAEFDQIDKLRSDLSEDVTGWQLCEEVLNHTLQRLKLGKCTKRWVVQMPEVVERDLKRISLPSTVTAYTLSRLQECIAFPTLESPQIRARFELMRRQLLAKSGKLSEAFATDVPSNPAMECAGLLKTIVESYVLGYNDIVSVLDNNNYLISLPNKKTPMLTGMD